MNWLINNIIEKIKIIEESFDFESKYIGGGLYFVYTEKLKDFSVLVSIKSSMYELLNIYDINKVIKLFEKYGYRIVPRHLMNGTGYIETKKGIITFVFNDKRNLVLVK